MPESSSPYNTRRNTETRTEGIATCDESCHAQTAEDAEQTKHRDPNRGDCDFGPRQRVLEGLGSAPTKHRDPNRGDCDLFCAS
mgnify:CR=1 FL=1